MMSVHNQAVILCVFENRHAGFCGLLRPRNTREGKNAMARNAMMIMDYLMLPVLNCSCEVKILL